jgi:hypothetical protein
LCALKGKTQIRRTKSHTTCCVGEIGCTPPPSVDGQRRHTTPVCRAERMCYLQPRRSSCRRPKGAERGGAVHRAFALQTLVLSRCLLRAATRHRLGRLVKFLSPALCPPHMPQSPGVITWAHGMELEPPEPPRAAVMAPINYLAPAACATELRWGPFLPVPSTGTRWHRWVRASNRHAARAVAGNSRPRGGLPAGEANPPSRYTSFGNRWPADR